MRKIKKIVGYCIGYLPFNQLRVLLYEIIFRYKIIESKIGWRTVIVVKKVSLYKCKIDSGNLFLGPMTVKLEEGASIGKNNFFKCGYWTEKIYNQHEYLKSFTMRKGSRISNLHFIDVAGSFYLGNNSRIAGLESQFWTHGAGVKTKNITIQDNCYIGSAVRIKPGVKIGDNCILGIGSVVSKNLNATNALIAGNPAKVIKENYKWKN